MSFFWIMRFVWRWEPSPDLRHIFPFLWISPLVLVWLIKQEYSNLPLEFSIMWAMRNGSSAILSTWPLADPKPTNRVVSVPAGLVNVVFPVVSEQLASLQCFVTHCSTCLVVAKWFVHCFQVRLLSMWPSKESFPVHPLCVYPWSLLISEWWFYYLILH